MSNTTTATLNHNDTQRLRMNAKTLEAVTRHGNTLLAAFPNAMEQNPVALCKKLRRIEATVSKPILDYCNGAVCEAIVDEAETRAFERLDLLLGFPYAGVPIIINRDPRGHALKIDDKWTRVFNEKRYKAKLPALHTDMGGYGIIAPDLTVDTAALAEREAGV